MQVVKIYKKYENFILSFLGILAVALFVGISFDYYYDANDDVYIKNILSGAYTGVPESRNIQMLYPISLIISLFYKFFPSSSVYGLFLCICHYGCLALLLARTIKFCQKTWVKILVVVGESLLFTGLLLTELVFTQYTVTCTMLAATAAFRFYTTPGGLACRKFFLQNIGNILLVILAFLIRSEMLLLVLPLICVVGVCKWAEENPIFTKENIIKYLLVFASILCGLLFGQASHFAAYRSPEWKEFTSFFDNRTELYDFQTVPSYEENKEFYESIGLTQGEQQLLVNYNFGLDEEINSELVGKIAAYADSKRIESRPFAERFREGLVDYKYLTIGQNGYPWNVVIFAAYGFLILFAWKNKSYSYLWKLPLLGIVRSGLWMYIIMGRRYPDRILHSLYLMELCILAAFLLEECFREWKNREKKSGNPFHVIYLFAVVMLVLGIRILPDSMEKVLTQSGQREIANTELQALEEYCSEHKENFYFVDLYSSVAYLEWELPYSEKMFEKVSNEIKNYDIMGGWVSKSPLTEKKLNYYGITTMEEGIADGENIYVIHKKIYPLDWLTQYYREKGYQKVELMVVDNIEPDAGSQYATAVFQVVKVSALK